MITLRILATAIAAVLAVPAPVLAAPAHRAGADCHVYNVLISTPTVRGHAKIRASGTVVCTSRPDSIHVRLSIQQHVRVSGHERWETMAFGPADHQIPAPQRRYRLPIGCRAGTFRTQLTIGGRSSAGRSGNRHFYSVPVVVTTCGSGGQHPHQLPVALAAGR